MIRTSDLTKAFADRKHGKVIAVNQVTFEVFSGEIFGLLGLNGAGKTTTLRLLAGLLKPDAGRISVDGIDVVAQPEKAKARLGFMTGATGLYGRLSAFEMITYFGRLYGMAEPQVIGRARKLIDMLGMAEYADTPCDKLSSGTRQKVSIARTMIHDPPVLILDEPTAGLDVIASRAVIDFINTEKARLKTIIFSTHVMHEAEKLCDRIGVLHGGRIVAIGTPQSLKASAGCEDMDEAFVRLVGETVEQH